MDLSEPSDPVTDSPQPQPRPLELVHDVLTAIINPGHVVNVAHLLEVLVDAIDGFGPDDTDLRYLYRQVCVGYGLDHRAWPPRPLPRDTSPSIDV